MTYKNIKLINMKWIKYLIIGILPPLAGYLTVYGVNNHSIIAGICGAFIMYGVGCYVEKNKI